MKRPINIVTTFIYHLMVKTFVKYGLGCTPFSIPSSDFISTLMYTNKINVLCVLINALNLQI